MMTTIIATFLSYNLPCPSHFSKHFMWINPHCNPGRQKLLSSSLYRRGLAGIERLNNLPKVILPVYRASGRASQWQSQVEPPYFHYLTSSRSNSISEFYLFIYFYIRILKPLCRYVLVISISESQRTEFKDVRFLARSPNILPPPHCWHSSSHG